MALPRTRSDSRPSGKVAEWFDERGYGFIDVANGERLFFHISQLRDRDARARVGDPVTFSLGVGRNGKPAAIDVQVAGRNARSQGTASRELDRPFARDSYRVYAAILLIVVVMAAVILDHAPLWVAAVYLVMGGVSAALYAEDKKRARDDTWRIPEANLHSVDFLGGIIGGLLAQHIFRHKTSKASYIAVTATIASLHLAVLLAVATGFLSPSAIEALVQSLR